MSRSMPLGGEIITLSALDFDAGNMISYRVVSGNADACFYLDENSGILTAKCDLGRLPVNRRVLNVTATDGQHFADVMPIEINLVETEGFRRDSTMNGRNAVFQCRTTNVAQRLREVLNSAEQSNARNSEDEFPRVSSRYLANIHYPVFQRLPRSFYVNETDSIGSFVFQVSQMYTSYYHLFPPTNCFWRSNNSLTQYPLYQMTREQQLQMHRRNFNTLHLFTTRLSAGLTYKG